MVQDFLTTRRLQVIVDMRKASTVDQYVAALHFAMTTMATVGDIPLSSRPLLLA